MNKLTDSEIVKALERCEISDCESCPFVHKGFTDCLKAFLDLINRQKAEIERLNKEVDRLSQCVMYHDGQIADALKEFAERLKKVMVATHKDINGYCHYRTEDCDIDNLVKEMVGE